jgi:hypothetical protein
MSRGWQSARAGRSRRSQIGADGPSTLAQLAAAFERAKAELGAPKSSSTTPARSREAASSIPHRKIRAVSCGVKLRVSRGREVWALRARTVHGARTRPRGIRIAHVAIDVQIDTPGLRATAPERAIETLLSPDAIAETYWQLHIQAPTCWTLELDPRPYTERL